METFMTPQERQLLADLFERVRSTATAPRDPEAEAFIDEAVRAQPYAPYALAQTALVQQHALEAASRRIAELEARAGGAAAQPTSFLGNLGRSLFGGAPAAAPRPGYGPGAYTPPPPPGPAPYPQQQPAYAPPPPAGPWGAPAAPARGGFLANAMTAATGVAGGLLAANAIESLLGGGRGGLFGGQTVGGLGGGETVNNFYETPSYPADQAPGEGLAGFDSGQNVDPGQDYVQDAGFDGGATDGGFDGGGFDGGGGFDNGGGTDV
jgi:hypothetical protein